MALFKLWEIREISDALDVPDLEPIDIPAELIDQLAIHIEKEIKNTRIRRIALIHLYLVLTLIKNQRR